jgi:HSP20 family protein
MPTMMFLTDLRPMSSFANAVRPTPTPAETFTPRVSLFESKDAYWVRMELPGITAEQLELTFERDELTVKGKKIQETLEEGMKWLRNERTYGAFERTFRFTTPVAADGVQAESRDGILTIRVAKAPESLPKKINIVTK